jgi:hypothetical protein
MKYALVPVCGTLLVLTTAMSAYAQAPAPASASEEAQARAASHKPAAAPVQPLQVATNRQTAVACNTCFTCGGDWPVFAGATHALNTGNLSFERGGSCSGAIRPSNDSNPFLCCR